MAASLALLLVTATAVSADTNPRRVLREAQTRVVKIFGAGGLSGLEAYQTGLLVSAEGHVLTVNSSVLDTGSVTVVTIDGARRTGEVFAADPVADLAVVKVDPAGETLPFWELTPRRAIAAGEPVWALANEFNIAVGNEPVSVRLGVVAGVAPLRGQGGATARYDRGEALLLDMVTSNPGAAGGVVIDLRGRLLGMLGRELRAEATGVWVSHAVPTAELARIYSDLLDGSGSRREEERVAPEIDLRGRWGFALAPDIGPRTPPYVDHVRPGGPADRAGLRADDLIVMGNRRVTATRDALLKIVGEVRPVTLIITVQRGAELIDIAIPSQDEAAQPQL